MYNMYMLDKIRIQVCRNVHILIWRHLFTWQWRSNMIKLIPRSHFTFCMKILISTSHINPKNEKIRIVESSSGNSYVH